MRPEEAKYFTENYPDCVVESEFEARPMRSCAHFPGCLLGINRYLPGDLWEVTEVSIQSQSIP